MVSDYHVKLSECAMRGSGLSLVLVCDQLNFYESSERP